MNARINNTVPNSININTGAVRLEVNRDSRNGVGVVEFNPNDITFVKNFKNLIHTHKVKVNEIKGKEKQISKLQGNDGDGFDKKIDPSIDLQLEACLWERGEIDRVFGNGTSDTVFGPYNNLDCFEQFYNAVAPYIQSVRDDKVNKYAKHNAPPNKGKR